MLVAARGVQGVFAALMAPAALSLVSTTFTDPGERATAFGIWGAIGGAGAAIGLLLGGILTQDLSWRWTMFVNLGFAVFDRVGGGDSFASGLIYGFLAGKGPQWAVECGAAHGALAMTTPGDTSMATLDDVLQVMKGVGARIAR